MGIWDKPTTGRDIKELRGGLPFRLDAAELEDVETVYGPGTRLSLEVVTLQSPEPELYTGFSAGIKAQVSMIEEGDLPTWVRIETKELGAGRTTTVLVPAENPEELDDLLSVNKDAQTDDDIPF